MSDVTHIVNDQRSTINETSKSFDSNESVINRSRPLINTSERQFVSQEPINPTPRFRPPDSNQFQLWRQPPPTGRPPLAYPPNRFPPRNPNEPRLPFPPARTPIPPLRTQEFQNRRSFEKPERPYDLELNQVENRLRPNSPWQRIRERLPLQSAEHPNDMESTQMKISAFEEAMNREMNKDRIPPFRRDSIVNADSRLKPQPEKRFTDEDDSARKNRPGDLLNQQNDLRKQSLIPGEFPRRDGPDPRIFDPNSQHRPSLTQLHINEQNFINQNQALKNRPLQAVPEYENRNYIVRSDEERLREDQNRNYRQDSFRDYRKLGDFENNINKENRKFARPEDFSQRSFDNAREMFNNRFDGEMNNEFGRGKNDPFNRFDVNGVNDKNALTKDKHLANDSKTILDKKPTANGDIKPPSSLPELKKEKSALKTPTRKISPKSPEIGSANSLGDKKKVPMNKVQVGAAPSPNLKVVRSKIGSLDNSTHKPGGGKVKIENRKLEWKAQPRTESKNDKYAPSGGDKKITQVKLQWSAKSKIGSLDNATHKPGGGDKKIESVKLDFKDKAKPKVGSKDNIKHVPGGGTVKKTTDVDAKSTSSNIEDQKVDIKAQSKVGSLDNVKHRPGGGDKKIFDDKEYLKQTTLTNESSKANSVTTSGSQAPEDSQTCSRDSQQKEKQIVAASVTSKKSNNFANDQVKSKHESTNESSKNDKKSQPSTPKKTGTSISNKTATLEKIMQISDTKVDQKPKPDSMPQLKPELRKISSVEKIKTNVDIKSKVPVAHPQELVKIPSKEKISFKDSKIPTQQMPKPVLEPISKSIEKKASDGESVAEKKSKLSNKEVTKNENNNNVEITTINEPDEKLSEDKSNLVTKPEAEMMKNQDLKSKIEPKKDIDFDQKPPVDVTTLKQNSKSKMESNTLSNDEKPPVNAIVTKKDSIPKIEPKSNINTDRKPSVHVAIKKDTILIEQKSNINTDTKPSVDVIMTKKDSVPKIEPKSNIDTDRKSSVDVTVLKKDSIPKIETKSNIDTDRKPSVDVITAKKDSMPKIEPKSNIDTDKKLQTDVTVLKKDSIPKTEPRLNSDTPTTEEKKELKIQDTKLTNVENKSSIVSDATKEPNQSTLNADLKQLNVNINKTPSVEKTIMKTQDPPSKVESNASSLNTGKTEEKAKSDISLKSKLTDAESKSEISNVVSTKEQMKIENNDSKELNSGTSDKNLTKDPSEHKDQQSKLPSTDQKNSTTSQSSIEVSNNQIEKNNSTENTQTKTKEPIKTLDNQNSKLNDEKSTLMKTDNNQNDVVSAKPNFEKISQFEVKQTSETFSPIPKSDAESKPSVTNIDRKSISESKSTNVPTDEVKSLPLSAGTQNESKISINVIKNERTDPQKNETSDVPSKVVSQNPQLPSSASSTSESKK